MVVHCADLSARWTSQRDYFWLHNYRRIVTRYEYKPLRISSGSCYTRLAGFRAFFHRTYLCRWLLIFTKNIDASSRETPSFFNISECQQNSQGVRFDIQRTDFVIEHEIHQESPLSIVLFSSPNLLPSKSLQITQASTCNRVISPAGDDLSQSTSIWGAMTEQSISGVFGVRQEIVDSSSLTALPAVSWVQYSECNRPLYYGSHILNYRDTDSLALTENCSTPVEQECYSSGYKCGKEKAISDSSERTEIHSFYFVVPMAMIVSLLSHGSFVTGRYVFRKNFFMKYFLMVSGTVFGFGFPLHHFVFLGSPEGMDADGKLENWHLTGGILNDHDHSAPYIGQDDSAFIRRTQAPIWKLIGNKEVVEMTSMP